ncbi:unnamed protein product [Cylicostephanus goldi]|uniref:Uncharacterized protein n=1 Tax=Cylicostephanus goldi TaxID=71465 RepID=A0A3P6QC78_CYLGO|nr:unnamed protein product [Cylicostephanus goldi]
MQLPTPTHFVPISTPRVDLPVEKKKKKKKSKKSKHRRHKERKRQRRYSSTSSSSTDDDSDASSSSSDDERKRKRKAPPVVVIKREKWGYLAYKEERSPEGSYIVYDKQYDHENFSMDVIPKGQTVDYRAHYYTVINGNSRLDEANSLVSRVRFHSHLSSALDIR